MSSIILTTLNAKYTHTAIGLRYLYSNLRELKSITSIQEHIITDDINEVAVKILFSKPSLVGVGVYIWNVLESYKLINIIKKVSPETIIVLGGPEVSYSPFRVDFSSADFIIQGEGENSFYSLCKTLFDNKQPDEKIIKSEYLDVKKVELPYDFYTDEDVLNRVIYVEASRGCPFSCEFCLSSMDKTVRKFDIDLILSSLSKLWDRGVRKFKFIDRTFNLDINISNRILEFFLQKEFPYFIHFEVIPECFPESLKEKIKRFPPTSIQLEIGIQTFNLKTAKNIKRKQNFEKIKQNLQFLEKETNAHLHIDLIIGLPGDRIEDFGNALNVLTSLSNAEIQIGILKKLSGTAIGRHDEEYGMVYSDLPPYEILQNNLILFSLIQEMKRFARFWDLIYNSGNFNKTVRLLWEDEGVFESFYSFSKWIYSETQATWRISLSRLAELIFKYLTEVNNKNKANVADIIIEDLLIVPGRKIPAVLRKNAFAVQEIKKENIRKINSRQIKHFKRGILN